MASSGLLAWEPPYAAGAPLEKAKKKEKKDKECSPYASSPTKEVLLKTSIHIWFSPDSNYTHDHEKEQQKSNETFLCSVFLPTY